MGKYKLQKNNNLSKFYYVVGWWIDIPLDMS